MPPMAPFRSVLLLCTVLNIVFILSATQLDLDFEQSDLLYWELAISLTVLPPSELLLVPCSQLPA